MLDSVCKFIRRHIKKSDTTQPPNNQRRPKQARKVSGRRNTGRWTDNKPLIQPDLGSKQLALVKKPQRKKTSRNKDAERTSSSPGSCSSATYEISMKDMENKKETNIRLQIRRPTGCPNAMKRELQKFNSKESQHSEGELDSREEGEADVGTVGIGGRTLSLNQQTLLVVVTNVANNEDEIEDWYPGKERDDIDSDNPYFADEKKQNQSCTMSKKTSDSDTPVSSEPVSECDEPGAITIGQRLSDVYDFNREDVYE